MKEYTRFSKTGKTSHFDCCVTWVLLYVQVLGPTVITYHAENYPRLHRGLFCAALTMYAGASSHSHFTFPAAVEGSSLRGGESIGKCGNSVMSNCILPVQIRQFRPLQVPKSSTCLLSYDWLAPQSRPASRNNNNNNNFICAHTKI